MTDYTHEERMHARKVLGIRDEDGKAIPLSERSVEALIETISFIQAGHRDKLTEVQGAIDALHKRLRAHRKGRALANKRADAACAAMRDLLDRFQNGTSS